MRMAGTRLSGVYENSIDLKSRIVIPQDFRIALGEDNPVYFTYSFENCIRIYTEETYDILYDRIQRKREEGEDTSALQALFIRPARKVIYDTAGRLLIPGDMKYRAHISDEDRETVVVGCIDHLEIWNKAEYYANVDQYFDVKQDLARESVRSIGAT